MPTIRINDRELSYSGRRSLLSILTGEKIFVNNHCSGKGTCGKCKVRILKGESPISDTDRIKLTPEELNKGIRLACTFFPEGDLEIESPEEEKKARVLTTGYLPEFDFCPAIRQNNSKEGTAVFFREELLDQKDTSEKLPLLGAAIDIGTTTVVCELVDLESGRVLGSESEVNAQKKYGLDVLTRITYELENPETGVFELQKAIVDSINEMIKRLCARLHISSDHIYEAVVGANCTMLHMFLGVDATSIGRFPYRPVFLESQTLTAESIGLKLGKNARVTTLPSVSSFIGGDIVAGTCVSNLKQKEGNVLFIDIGTNGEIVLKSGNRLLCCSCAAGPALEGMNISSGMRAQEGAVEDLRILPDRVDLKVIGNTKPLGLCGSGILAAIRELLLTGIVGRSGTFVKPEKLDPSDYRLKYIRLKGKKREFIISGPSGGEILVTQNDVRQVQLAKGAILSGFTALLNKAGIGMGDLDEVMIAGQFGAHLPGDSLTGVGILPKEVEDKLTYIGNSSKTGAYMALMSEKVRQEMTELAGEMEYLELAETVDYERLFSECLIFPGQKEA